MYTKEQAEGEDAMGKSTFAVLVLIGRPASGKSEIIDFLQHTPPAARRRRFHLADRLRGRQLGQIAQLSLQDISPGGQIVPARPS